MKKIETLYIIIILIMIIGLKSCNNNDSNPVKPTPEDLSKYVWVCGDTDSAGYGAIFFSQDGGTTWMQQGIGQTALLNNPFNDIWAIDKENVIAVGVNSLIRTNDGGKTWLNVDIAGIQADRDLITISVFNKKDIWISGGNGLVLHSDDKGSTWNVIDSSFFGKSFLQGILAVNENVVYVAGGVEVDGNIRGFIALTNDKGRTWKTITPENDYNKNEWIGIKSFGNTVVIYGQKSHYIVSHDNGYTWKNDSVPNTGGVGGADINHLIMLDENTWWGAFDMGQIYLTNDGGKNWTEQTTGQSAFYLLGIDAWDSKTALAVGSPTSYINNCPVIKTDDGGTNWNKVFSTSNISLRKVTFIKER